ncbi:MAG TPA: hypothetical protein VNT60_10700, partial [Deinococcales bacterium]|nr:hypothetical protein [Deinococcales bacterium]
AAGSTGTTTAGAASDTQLRSVYSFYRTTMIGQGLRELSADRDIDPTDGTMRTKFQSGNRVIDIRTARESGNNYRVTISFTGAQ